ncbi:cellulose synthase complex outer membrane protein BcsC [uncultured Cedecea sp.]|uniref:cellulose synthase complex outer membrane protein BcsC n=1 Tax=uncultured Cedecea sp. TaxID=988762 RepID=UPI00261F24A3|nr:cellulose synthase complex outer membrane protein BcsC [uncultured Cedecea sp.]
MGKYSLNIITLSWPIIFAVEAQAAPATPTQQLLENLYLGESLNRQDLIDQTLSRLVLTDTHNPDVIAARLRLLLRQGDNEGAKQQLDILFGMAPDSRAYRESFQAYLLANPALRLQLQQARLFTSSGNIPAAINAYKKIFSGTEPAGDLAVEYWMTVAKQPSQMTLAFNQLNAIKNKDPGNIAVQMNIARLQFNQGKLQEGFKLLEEIAQTPTGRDDAAKAWYAQIKDMPVSQASTEALQHFLVLFDNEAMVNQAKSTLDTQQKQLQDPAFRSRAKGLDYLSRGNGAAAIPQLQIALRNNSDDSELVGALGQAYSQQNQRELAIKQLQKAIEMDPQSSNRSKWNNLLETNRYWLLIAQGDKQLEAKQFAAAQQSYQRALQMGSRDSYAVKGLGDVALAQKYYAGAERYYQQALRIDKNNSNVLSSLISVYSQQSEERAQAFIASLSPGQKKRIDGLLRRLEDEGRERKVRILEQLGQWAQAAVIQRQRLENDPDNAWLAYQLASNLNSAGQHQDADNVMRDMAGRSHPDAERVYAYALYLSGHSRDSEALKYLNTFPHEKWNKNITDLAARLNTQIVIAQARQMREKGELTAAFNLLANQPASENRDLLLGEWATEANQFAVAEGYYKKVLGYSANNTDALLGLAKISIAQNNLPAARHQLQKIILSSVPEESNTRVQRVLASLWSTIGEQDKADKLFARLAQWAKHQPPSMENALILRDAARFYIANGQPQLAKQAYKDAMPAAQISKTAPTDDTAYTQLTRNNEQDDWLKSSIRREAGDLYRQQDVNVTLSHEYGGSSGTPGYSDLKTHTTMLQIDAPLSDGRVWFRTDKVSMNAGSLSDNNAPWGTCREQACFGVPRQTANGVSLATGWKNQTWQMDIGTTPLGFDVVDIVGGISYSGDTGDVGYTLNLHRRPISNSLLAFAGQRDPNTNTTWGGVRATGVGVSASYDQGEEQGFWASIDADSLKGKNVEDNWKLSWMGGYYYKLLNESNQRLTVGANNMLWHYNKDLGDYYLGQGGYFSPQKYISFSVPVTWRKRTENWSWELSTSASWSYSQTSTHKLYPIASLLNNGNISYPEGFDINAGTSSNGFGYTAQALIERRLNENWSIGAGIDLQHAKDYTPSHALIYLRYSQAGWLGDLDLPPQPLIPYANF